jgi:hypothetical protein
MAHPEADAPTVPMTWQGIALASGLLGLVVGAAPRIQRPGLPYGLRPGRHDVAARVLGPGASSSLWYPARCGRRAAAPGDPCRDAPPDTGRLPVLVLLWKSRSPVSADTVTAEYLASHGYVVVAGGESSPAGLRALSFVDTARIATAELRPAGALLFAAARGRRFSVDQPPGSGDHIRLSAVITHAFLDAALRDGPAALPDLARRLGATGLTVRLGTTAR